MLKRFLMTAALLASASPLLAQTYSDARVLGGTTAFYHPALTNAASLKRMADSRGIADDIRTVLRDAGIPQVSDAVVAVLSGASSAQNVGSCSNAAPADGVLVECQAQTGSTVEWMAYKPLVNGKHLPGRLERIRWAGKRPYAAFLFRVSVDNIRYTFIIPKPCANLSLVSAPDTSARDQAARDQAARDQAARDQAARDQAARDQAARDQAARDQAARDQAARDQAARDQAARDQAARDQTARNEAAQAQVAVAAAPAPEPWVEPSLFFVDGLLGGERRNRPADLVEGKRTDYNQGSGLIGLRIGVAKKFKSNWEVGGVFGLGAMFTFDHDTTDQWPFTLDLEVNKYLGRRVFIGSGLSIWDFTRDDTWTPAAPLRIGIAMGDHPRHPIVLLVEGRWFIDHATHLSNHYQAWAGVRIHFG